MPGALLEYAQTCRSNPMRVVCGWMLVVTAGYFLYILLVYLSWLYLFPYSCCNYLFNNPAEVRWVWQSDGYPKTGDMLLTRTFGEFYVAGLHSFWAWACCFPFWAVVATLVARLYKAQTI